MYPSLYSIIVCRVFFALFHRYAVSRLLIRRIVALETPYHEEPYVVSFILFHSPLFLRSLLTLFIWLSKKCWKALQQILQGDVSNKAILSIGSCRFVNWLKPFYRLAYATLFSVSGDYSQSGEFFLPSTRHLLEKFYCQKTCISFINFVSLHYRLIYNHKDSY